MTSAITSTCAALALVAIAAGCSSTERPQRTSANMQAAPPQQQDQGWAALVEADREIRTLEKQRDAATDPFVREAMTHQIDAIMTRSDELLDEMSLGDGRSHDTQIRRMTSNLQRAMGAGVAAERQGAEH